MSKSIYCDMCGEEVSLQTYKKHLQEKHFTDLESYLIKYFTDNSLRHTCKECGKFLTFNRFPVLERTGNKPEEIFYVNSFCSNRCQLLYQYKNSSEEEKQKRRDAIKNAWNKEGAREAHSLKMAEIQKSKSKEEMELMVSNVKKTKKERYGDENFNNLEKAQKTCLEKYGVRNPFELKEFSKNGTEEKIKKVKETVLERYGVDWINKSDSFRNLFKDKDFVSKRESKKQQTSLKRYGSLYYEQSEEYNKNKPDIVKKIRDTKRKNKTTNTSRNEKEILSWLKEEFGEEDVEKEYASNEYPFMCDFYIKSIDMYIEYQGFFSHGKKPYDERDIECCALVDKWDKKIEETGSLFFKNAKKVYTERDVEKRRLAKENNLNYLEIFSYADKEDLLSKIKGENIYAINRS